MSIAIDNVVRMWRILNVAVLAMMSPVVVVVALSFLTGTGRRQ
jgi:hypothetical protein